MKIRAEFASQDDMQVEITIRGTLGEFRRMTHQLSPLDWPSSDLRRDLDDVVRRVSRVVYAEPPVEG